MGEEPSSVLAYWGMIQDRSSGSCAWRDGVTEVRFMCLPRQCEKRSGYRSGQSRHLILRPTFLLSSHARQSAFRGACTLACDHTEWLKWRRRRDVNTSWNVAFVWKLLPTGLPEPQTTLANLEHSQLVNSAMNHCSYLIHRSLVFAFFSKFHESAMLLLGILIWRTRKTWYQLGLPWPFCISISMGFYWRLQCHSWIGITLGKKLRTQYCL